MASVAAQVAALAAGKVVALGVALDRSLAADQDRPLEPAAQDEAWVGLAQGPQGILSKVAFLRVGFLQEVGIFHKGALVAGQEGAAQTPQEEWGGNLLQVLQDIHLAC